jgi:YjbE family integral membrane protein
VEYLLTFFSIFFINILLSGDNALVIALASRNLPKNQKSKAILFGSVGAVVFRIVLSFIAVYLLTIPYLQLAGGILLLWIAIKLISEDQSDSQHVEAKRSLWGAIQTIIVADVVMSLDNVVAIAGVAKGDILLIVIGLAISVPLIIWGSNLISLLMQKWPIIIIFGAALLGWTAGDMILADKKIAAVVAEKEGFLSLAVPAVCAILAVIIGKLIVRLRDNKKESESES